MPTYPQLPDTMNVMEISQPGEPNVLVLAQRPLPTLTPSEIWLKVAAAGVNHPDVMQRRGHYPPPPGASDIPGLEVAGGCCRRRAQCTKISAWRSGLRANRRWRLCRILPGR